MDECGEWQGVEWFSCVVFGPESVHELVSEELFGDQFFYVNCFCAECAVCCGECLERC